MHKFNAGIRRVHRPDITHLTLEKHKNLYIIGGVHGAGKSTFCRELIRHLQLPYITPEELKTNLPRETSKTQLLKHLKKQIDQLIGNGQSFYFEHVMSGNFVEKLIMKAKTNGFRVSAVYIDIESADTALSRVDQRVNDGGHNIDREKVHSRLQESWENFTQKYAPNSDSWAIYNNSGITFKLIDSQ